MSGKWEERQDFIIDNANSNLCLFVCPKENSLIYFILSTDFIQQRENISLAIPREDFFPSGKVITKYASGSINGIHEFPLLLEKINSLMRIKDALQ